MGRPDPRDQKIDLCRVDDIFKAGAGGHIVVGQLSYAGGPVLDGVLQYNAPGDNFWGRLSRLERNPDDGQPTNPSDPQFAFHVAEEGDLYLFRSGGGFAFVTAIGGYAEVSPGRCIGFAIDGIAHGAQYVLRLSSHRPPA